MATNSYKTFLMKGTTASTPTYSKLVDIKTTPSLQEKPEALETTTLSDGQRTYIPGIKEIANGGLEFKANYTVADYQTLVALEGTETNFAVWYGGTESGGVATPTGSEGKWAFKGYLSVTPNELDVNVVREMTVTIMPSSVMSFSVGS